MLEIAEDFRKFPENRMRNCCKNEAYESMRSEFHVKKLVWYAKNPLRTKNTAVDFRKGVCYTLKYIRKIKRNETVIGGGASEWKS